MFLKLSLRLQVVVTLAVSCSIKLDWWVIRFLARFDLQYWIEFILTAMVLWMEIMIFLVVLLLVFLRVDIFVVFKIKIMLSGTDFSFILLCFSEYCTKVSRNANIAKLQAGYLFPEVRFLTCYLISS